MQVFSIFFNNLLPYPSYKMRERADKMSSGDTEQSLLFLLSKLQVNGLSCVT